MVQKSKDYFSFWTCRLLMLLGNIAKDLRAPKKKSASDPLGFLFPDV